MLILKKNKKKQINNKVVFPANLLDVLAIKALVCFERVFAFACINEDLTRNSAGVCDRVTNYSFAKKHLLGASDKASFLTRKIDSPNKTDAVCKSLVAALPSRKNQRKDVLWT